jgi:hypothetical protein
MTVLMSVLSEQFIVVPVTLARSGAPYDPTADAVSFAFTAPGKQPVSTDWVNGQWETTPRGTYNAKCLVGPTGAIALPVGTYLIWVRVTDNPEVPVRQVDTLVVQ